MNYPQKTGFNWYQTRHCAYITYSEKTWFLKILSVSSEIKIFHHENILFCPNPLYAVLLKKFDNIEETK